MEKKRFHISDVLSITTGRLVSNRHIGGVYDILGFMTGENLFTHQLPRASEQCRPFLAAQFPQLASDELQADIVAMCDALPDDKAEAQIRITAWLAKTAERHGEFFDVEKLPAGDSGHVDPLQELVEMVGPDRVIVAEVPRPEHSGE